MCEEADLFRFVPRPTSGAVPSKTPRRIRTKENRQVLGLEATLSQASRLRLSLHCQQERGCFHRRSWRDLRAGMCSDGSG